MYNVYVPLKLKQHLEYDRPFQSSELFLSLQNKAKCKAFLVQIWFHGTKETFFNINSIALSLPLKQMLGATLKGQGVLPYKSDRGARRFKFVDWFQKVLEKKVFESYFYYRLKFAVPVIYCYC